MKRYWIVSIALALACVLSLIAGKIWPLSYGGQSSEIHILKDSLKLWYLFWPPVLWVGLSALATERRQKILATWISAMAVLGVISVIQHFTGWPRPQIIPGTEGLPRYHATLFLGHHLSVASILIFPFFAALDFFRAGFFKGRRSWLWGLGAAFGAIALFLTYSRTLWAAVPFAFAIWILMNLPKRAVLVAFFLMLAGAGAVTQVKSVTHRFTNYDFRIGFEQRADLWEANLKMLRERPLLGVGWKHNQELSGYYLMQKYPGQSVFSGHAHNNLLDMLGGTGILGALAWLAWSIFVIALAFRAWRRKMSSPEVFASGLFCAWIAFQINGVTQVNFWEAKVTHQVMWMAAWSLLWNCGSRPGEFRENA